MWTVGGLRDSVSFVVDDAGDNVMEWDGEDCRDGVSDGLMVRSSEFVGQEEGRGCEVLIGSVMVVEDEVVEGDCDTADWRLWRISSFVKREKSSVGAGGFGCWRTFVSK